MAQIVPAILEETKEGFLTKLSLVMRIPGVQRVQVDFGDGVFIPTKLLSADEIDGLNPAIHWEAHLMVNNPSDFLDYQIAGFKTVYVHYEAFPSPNDLKDALMNIKKLGLKPGLALNPSTVISAVPELALFVDNFLVMGVVPGKQGQSFIEATVGRVAELRKLMPNAIIEVDGGISLDNVRRVVDAGAELVIAGNAVVNQPNPAEAFEKLKLEANKN